MTTATKFSESALPSEMAVAPPSLSLPEAPKVGESKHPGAMRDFAGTWLAYVPMHALEEQFAKWTAANLDAAHLAPADRRGCKGGIVTDQSLTVLMGLAAKPSAVFAGKVAAISGKFSIRFGTLKSFEGANDGYRVLMVEILQPEHKPLHVLQAAIGCLAVPTESPPIVWHHSDPETRMPAYRPHLTVAFVTPEAAARFEGQRIMAADDEVVVDTLEFKLFRDKSEPPVVVRLN